MTKSKIPEAYARIIEAFRHTESFDDMIRPEDVAELFLNLTHHFIDCGAAAVWTSENHALTAQAPLAARGMTPEMEADVLRHITPEWIDYFRREFRPVMVPHASPSSSDTSSQRSFFTVPLYFGRQLLGYGVLVLDDGVGLVEWQIRVVEILSRAAGVALGRLHQAGQIESERDYARGLFASIVSQLMVVDEKGLIVEINPAAEETLGNDVRGQNYRDVFGFVRHDPIRDCLKTGAPQHRVEAFGQSGRLWGVTASPFSFTAARKGAIIGFRDLTEVKRMEEILAATEQQASIGRMAATVAHEVNNPLGAIKAYLKIVSKELGSATMDANTRVLNTRVREKLDVISEQVDRIARTVQGLLGFSRMRAAPGMSVALSDVMRNVIALFEGGLREKGIALRTSIPADLPAVRADTDQIQEVLVNLLENGRDALDEGRSMEITVRNVSDEIEICVEDDGPGLGDNPERVMAPFFTTKTNGTGLGLTIARRICEAHGGRLLAESRPATEGGGARFRVLLPVKQ